MSDLNVADLSYAEMNELREKIDNRIVEVRNLVIDEINSQINTLESLGVPAFRILSNMRKPKPKYYDEATQKSWSGRGKKPNWLADALNEGKTLDDFLVS